MFSNLLGLLSSQFIALSFLLLCIKFNKIVKNKNFLLKMLFFLTQYVVFLMYFTIKACKHP